MFRTGIVAPMSLDSVPGFGPLLSIQEPDEVCTEELVHTGPLGDLWLGRIVLKSEND